MIQFQINGVEVLARQFAELSDDAQAEFFCYTASILRESAGDALDTQGYFIGRKLRIAPNDFGDAGREFVRAIVAGMLTDGGDL